MMTEDMRPVSAPVVEAASKPARKTKNKATKPAKKKTTIKNKRVKKVAKQMAKQTKPIKAKGVRKPAGNGKIEHLPVTIHTVPDSTRLSVIAKWKKDNPKSPLSPAAKRFELYRQVKTVGEYRAAMRKAGKPHFANLDLARDRERGYVNFRIGR